MNVRTLLAFAALAATSLVLHAPAKAGQLFPPSNLTNATSPCPNGEVLTWTGDSVICIDPTAGISVTCPTGSVLTGIAYGKPICTSIATVIANATATSSTSTSSSSSSSSSSTSSSSSNSSSNASSSSNSNSSANSSSSATSY